MVRSIVGTLGDSGGDEGPECTRTERRLIKRYASTLPEPSKSVLLHRLDGMTPREISTATGLEFTDVCRMLAKLYSELRVTLEPSG